MSEHIVGSEIIPILSVEDICVLLDTAEQLAYQLGANNSRSLHRATDGTKIYSEAYFLLDGTLQQDRYIINPDGLLTHKWVRSGGGLVENNPGSVYAITASESESINSEISGLLALGSK